MAEIVSTASAEHYKWGGIDSTDCDGWHLVKTLGLSVIEELMPPGTRETCHIHEHARQFFYVLEGQLTIEIENEQFLLRARQGIKISSKQRHLVANLSLAPARFIVISQPPSHGDKIHT